MLSTLTHRSSIITLLSFQHHQPRSSLIKKKKKATTHTQKENTKKANRTEQWHRPADFIPPK